MVMSMQPRVSRRSFGEAMAVVRPLFVLPRNMHFGPHGATSIDLCVRDLVNASRNRAPAVIAVGGNGPYFPGFQVANLNAGRDTTTRQKVAAVLALLRQSKFDIVVVQQHLPTAAGIASSTDIPVVFQTHNFQKRFSKDAIGKLRRFLRLQRYTRLAGMLHVSEACRRDFAEHWPEFSGAQAVVYNGLDLPTWSPAADRELEILCVGRSAPEKGILEAARAVGRLLAIRPTWRARFILAEPHCHPDYHRSVVEALGSGERRVIETNQPFEFVKHCAERAAIAIVPSKWREPFGRTALEAHAGGCAVISSGTGGLTEISGPHARYLSAVQEDSIREATLELMDDAARRRELARAGQLHVQKFGSREIARQLDVFIENVVLGSQRDGLASQRAELVTEYADTVP
jgi:glycosyltransferase involved in cell wall biosynthesis